MNVTLTYSLFNLESLPALAAAFSRNIRIYEKKSDKNVLSMAPDCELIVSRNAIIFFLLNIDQLKASNSDDILWHEGFIKPIFYQFYKSFNPKLQDKSQINRIVHILELIDEKFGFKLQHKLLSPLELVLWGDLYLILSDNSPFAAISNKWNLPPRLKGWFNAFNSSSECLEKAAKLALGDIERNIIEITKRIHIQINIPFLEIETQLKNMSINSDLKRENNQLNNDSLIDEIKMDFLNGYQSISEPFVGHCKPKLPLKDRRNILITSALPYVNNVPHLGNLIGSTLSADVFSRYCRIRNWNSLYICGTDEYGTTTEVKASEEKTTPRQICDHYHAIHADIYKWFNIDFDMFGRTSVEAHTQIVCEVFQEIYKQGFIIEDTVTQLFCEKCEKFLADRLVEGICPFCSYEDARGDQCDKCGKLINTVELKQPRCKLCSGSPVFKTSKHLFLDLTKIQEKLEAYLKETMESPESAWSTNAKSITNSWLKDGLKPRCITRDLKWGVPVPLEHFKDKVFYVWFDAVLGYLSITSAYTANWRQWWLKEEAQGAVELYQFMAKDNVPFHSVILPANLMATGSGYNLIKQLASTEYLNYENTKFSKSRGLGVFGNDAKASGIPADLWRFYLICSRPESQDSSFMWDEFATRINSELLNNLGNFINRALTFVVKFFGGTVPDFRAGFSEEEGEFVGEVNAQIHAYVRHMDELKLREALFIVLKISGLGNGYIQKHKPWVNVKSDATKAQAAVVIGVAANLAVQLAVLLCPVMPDIADNILRQCSAPGNCKQILDDCRFRAFLQPGHQIGTVAPLFQKMEPDFVNLMKSKFSQK